MIISGFTKPHADIFIEYCNFVGCEQPLFELRNQGVPIEEIAEKLHLTVDGAKKTSQRVDKKIEFVIFYALIALNRH